MGKGIQNNQCDNTHIINELNVPILCMALKNVVVAASSEGILVSDKEQSSYIKPFVEEILCLPKSLGEVTVSLMSKKKV